MIHYLSCPAHSNLYGICECASITTRENTSELAQFNANRAREQGLEQHNADLIARVQELETELKTSRQFWETSMRSIVRDKDQQIATLRRELAERPS